MISPCEYTNYLILGHYCDFNDQPIEDYTSYACPEGYYCPNGTEYSTQYGCPPGTYSPATKLTSSQDCLPCPTGKYCYGSNETYTGTTNLLLSDSNALST